jgi:hypothetical protein
MPLVAIMKEIGKKGIILSCGVVPPTAEIVWLPITLLGASVEYWLIVLPAHTALDGLVVVPGVDTMFAEWVCLGNWLTNNWTCSTPPIWPNMYLVPEEAVPWWSGMRPLRSGSAKVDTPFPPYVVPINANNASY